MADSERRVTNVGLVELLDRVIEGGAVVSGDLIIALAGIDLVRIDLRLMLSAIEGTLDEATKRIEPR